MSKFKVGEIVTIKSMHHPEYNGKEVEITHAWPSSRYSGSDHYIDPDPQIPKNPAGWNETAFRRLPPKDTPSSWEDMKDLFIPKAKEVV